MFRILFACACLLWAPTLKAEDEDLLKLLFSRSELIVLAKVEQAEGGFLKGPEVTHNYKVKIIDVIEGRKTLDKEIRVMVHRFESEKADQLPYLKEGATCIFFLNKSQTTTSLRDGIPVWETNDSWFGVQPGSPMMATVLRSLVEERSETEEGKAPEKSAQGPPAPRSHSGR
jgi:hypothetical protein